MTDGFDIYDILQSYPDKDKEEDAKQIGGGSARSSENTGDSERAVLQKMAENVRLKKEDGVDDPKIEDEGELEGPQINYELENPKLQERIVKRLLNSLQIKNTQKIILLNNRENMRKGLEPEIGGRGNRVIGKNQMSTVAIPTQFLTYIRQEVGGLASKVTQNDLLAGFLYWYFGKPTDIAFADEITYDKIEAIADGLNLNASPSNFNKQSLNTSNVIADKLAEFNEKLDLISTMLSQITKGSIENGAKMDKMNIAICYSILNALAFTPPMSANDKPNDIDMLANGQVWDLQESIGLAYDYYKSKNGRDIYKSKVRSKIRQFQYDQKVVSETSYPQESEQEEIDYSQYYGDDDDNYEDVDMGDVVYDDDEAMGYLPMEGAAEDDQPSDLAAMKEQRARKKRMDDMLSGIKMTKVDHVDGEE